MLRNIQKTVIGKPFLISLLVILIMFASAGLDMHEAYAADLNDTNEMELDLDMEDKLEDSQESEMPFNIYSLNGGTFEDIQNVVNIAHNGDRIELNGEYGANGENVSVAINKKLVITSPSQATLDGENLTNIFRIYEKGSQSVLSNLKFINGFTDDKGGAVRINARNITLDNCVFENNHALGGSGAVYTSYLPQVAEGLTVKNCNFTNNKAGTSAGALGSFGQHFKIINCIFDSNSVYNDKACYGGAIQIGLDTNVSYGTVLNSIFINNKAESSKSISHGGAGCVRNGSSYYNCIFINNSADFGGALTYHASGNLNNCTLINNTAKKYGGAVAIWLNHDFMDLNITNSKFIGNQAPLGGAVKLDGFNIKIENSTFEDNYASQYGGAVNIEAFDVKIIDSDFQRNIANIDGGAVYIKGNDTAIMNSRFIANEAIPDVSKLNDGLGGAIYVNSTKALAQNNIFKLNTARNGSALYFDKYGVEFKLINNTLYQNQAWVYALPIQAHDIYYGDDETIKSVIYGGNNIADFDNLAVSNAIYNAADFDKIEIDGEHPVSGATNSGKLYQDDREYNMEILMTVKYEDGSVVYNRTLNSSYLGQVSFKLSNLRPGKYYVTAKHYEDNYYKEITNTTTFNVIPKTDNKISKSVNKQSISYGDSVVWTLNVTNAGPNNSTDVVVYDTLPEGLVWQKDNTNGKYNPKTGVLNIGSLNAGQTIIVKITTLVNRTGVITNNASVEGKEFDTNMSNNHDELKIDVPRAADLKVTKKVNNSSPNFGDLICWTVEVFNNGPDVAHDVEVCDSLPESLIFVDSTGNYDRKTGTWLIKSLSVGKSVRLTLICSVNQTGSIRNSVNVSANEFDWNLSNNFDDEVIDVAPAADLKVTKSANNSNPNLGELISWNIVVSNNGPDVAHNIKVSDILPDSLVFVNATAYYNVKTNAWLLYSLNVGRSVKLTIVCRVNQTGSIRNSVNVTLNEFDWNLSNNFDDDVINVNPACDLEVVKSVNDSNPNFQNLVCWTVEVLNNGPDVAHDIVVQDILPKSLIFVNATGYYDAKSNSWFVNSLGAGKSVKLTLVSRVNGTGEIKNRVKVTSKEFDINMDNNHDEMQIDVPEAADLKVTKKVNNSSPNFGDLVTWEVIVLNKGPDVAHDVKVQDILPKSLILVNAGGNYDVKNGLWLIKSLGAGKSVKLTLVCRVNETGEIANRVTVTSNEFDWNLTDNSDEELISIPPACDLKVIKLVNDSNPNFRDLVCWSIIVLNNGPDVAHDIEVKDILPKSLVFVDTNGNYDIKTGRWLIKSLDINESVKLDIISLVNATGNITNAVSVSANEFDFNLTNNNASNTVFVEKSGDLSIAKTVNVSEVNYGNLIKWTITVSNDGPDKVTDIVVEDVMPNGLILVDYGATKGFFDEGIWSFCCLEKNEIETLELICKVNKTGNVTNAARIYGREYDYNMTNNEDNESVSIAPAADISVSKQADNERPFFGDIVTWTIKVENNGPDQANDIRIFDNLDEDLIFHSYESTKGVYRDGIWSIDQLNKGDCEYINISCYVNGLGVIANNVSAIAAEFDIDMSNNHDESFIDASPLSDLKIQKMVNVSNANYGEFVKWTLMASNEGPNDATGVIVEETMPDSLQYIESNGDGEYIEGIWEIGDLKVGETKTLEIICKIIETGNIVNSAIVYGNEEDCDLSDNEVEVSIDVPPAADLSVSKTVSRYEYKVGDLIEYSIRIINNGPDNALNVKVRELFDSSLVLKSFKQSTGSYDSLKNEWHIDELVSGGEETLLMEFEAIMGGMIENAVSVTSDAFDINTDNNEDSVLVKVVQNTTNKTDMDYQVTQIKLVANDSVKSDDIDFSLSNLQNYSTTNPIMLLMAALLFSIVFGSFNILKKR
ncbi:hypothetical protein [Methanobrevibacter sp.]